MVVGTDPIAPRPAGLSTGTSPPGFSAGVGNCIHGSDERVGQPTSSSLSTAGGVGWECLYQRDASHGLGRKGYCRGRYSPDTMRCFVEDAQYSGAEFGGCRDTSLSAAGRVGRSDPEYGLGRRGFSPGRYAPDSKRCLASASPTREDAPTGCRNVSKSSAVRVGITDPEYGLGRRGPRQTEVSSTWHCLRHDGPPAIQSLGSCKMNPAIRDAEYGLGQRGSRRHQNSDEVRFGMSDESSARSEPPQERHGRRPPDQRLKDGRQTGKSLQFVPLTPRPTRDPRAQVLKHWNFSSFNRLAGGSDDEGPDVFRKPPLPRAISPGRSARRCSASQPPTTRSSRTGASISPSVSVGSGRRGFASRDLSPRQQSPNNPLGLCWTGTKEGGLEKGQQSFGLWGASDRSVSPSLSNCRHGNAPDFFFDGGLPTCIGRGKRRVDTKVGGLGQADHFLSSGVALDDKGHGHAMHDSFQDGLLRGIGHGKRHIDHVDHFVGLGTAAGDIGLHGHSKDDVYEGGLERGVGRGKRHIPVLDHFDGAGCAGPELVLPKSLAQGSTGVSLDADARLGPPLDCVHAGSASDLDFPASNNVGTLAWISPAVSRSPSPRQVSETLRAETPRMAECRRVAIRKEYARVASESLMAVRPEVSLSWPTRPGRHGPFPRSSSPGVDVHDLGARRGDGLRTAPSSLWMRWAGSAEWPMDGSLPSQDQAVGADAEFRPAQAAGIDLGEHRTRVGDVARFDADRNQRPTGGGTDWWTSGRSGRNRKSCSPPQLRTSSRRRPRKSMPN